MFQFFKQLFKIILPAVIEEVVNQIFFGLPTLIMIVIDAFVYCAVTQALPFYETSSMDPLEHLKMLSHWTLPSLLFATFICCFDAQIFNNASAYLLFKIMANLLTLAILTIIKLYFDRYLQLTQQH
ncbi:hypothetical protein [Lactiplantibacillus pentosus]|uniref:hypothetical protein n=1 Tax=Lactiplantibacillus pentosus TaxID=1589 RepID=UPI002182377E|nr:hypothetical protein [Lactiplantibacillus pentosus]MCT0162596.1 hypothetical protein [Lactiplantibacillus pentosus]